MRRERNLKSRARTVLINRRFRRIHFVSLYADEIKWRRENGWYARRNERDGKRFFARIRKGRRVSRQRGRTKDLTSSSRSAAPHRECWNPPTLAAPLSGAPARLLPPPMSWCSLRRNLSLGGPPRGSLTAAKNGPLPPADSIGSPAKVSRFIFLHRPNRIHQSSPKSNRERSLMSM